MMIEYLNKTINIQPILSGCQALALTSKVQALALGPTALASKVQVLALEPTALASKVHALALGPTALALASKVQALNLVLKVEALALSLRCWPRLPHREIGFSGMSRLRLKA